MHIYLLTIFPDIFDSYLKSSIIGRAVKAKKVHIHVVDIRTFTRDRHKKVDDAPYGGGPGMVMQVEPIVRALKKIAPKKSVTTRILLTSAKGKIFTQAKAHALVKHKKIIIICGHYEGVDERIIDYIDEEISVGEYVLTGGELPALTIADALIRLIPGVLGHAASHVDESHEQKGVLEYPQYTRPLVFAGKRVPKVLLSGDHKKIREWREGKRKTV